MDMEAPSDSTSAEFVDAEDNGDFYEDAVNDQEDQKHSIINDIREEIGTTVKGSSSSATDGNCLKPQSEDSKSLSKSESFSSEKSKEAKGSVESIQEAGLVTRASALEITPHKEEPHDYMHDTEWRNQKKHIFILSEAGKPIYSLHGNEDKLASLFGIIQALVSFVQHGQDAITSIHARGIKFVFLVRGSLILVAASRTNMSVSQLQMQLIDVYNQILSMLTLSHMNKIFEKRKNFDLRRLLAGSERLISNLLSNDSSNKKITNNVFTSLTNSIRVLPLPTSVRSNIVSAIQSNCSKIKNLVFAVMIANNKLITLVRMKNYSMHPIDLRIIFNLIDCSESFKASENWTPICLPKFDMNGFLHAHVSYLADDCPACLLLLSVDRDAFFTLSDAKRRITEKMRRSHCLEAISEELKKGMTARIDLNAMGLSEMRHFVYKPKAIAQILCSEIEKPYNTVSDFELLEAVYCKLLHRIHNTSTPLKLVYEQKQTEATLGWVTAAYDFYAIFEPTVQKTDVIKHVDKLIKRIEKEHDVFFIRNHPNF